MAPDVLSGVTITTDEQFNSLLSELLDTATNGGVEVTGPCTCDKDGGQYDWEVEIVELLAEPADDD